MIKKFLLGEVREIRFRVKSTKNEKLVILTARYIIYRNNEVYKSGECTIENDIISMIFDCDEVGSYIMEIRYEIAPEVRKVRCKIDVGCD